MWILDFQKVLNRLNSPEVSIIWQEIVYLILFCSIIFISIHILSKSRTPKKCFGWVWRFCGNLVPRFPVIIPPCWWPQALVVKDPWQREMFTLWLYPTGACDWCQLMYTKRLCHEQDVAMVDSWSCMKGNTFDIDPSDFDVFLAKVCFTTFWVLLRSP